GRWALPRWWFWRRPWRWKGGLSDFPQDPRIDMDLWHRLNRASRGLQRFQRAGWKQNCHLPSRKFHFGLGRLMRRKQLRLEQQCDKEKNVKRDGRKPRHDLPLGLLFSLLGNDQLHFPGAENVRVDQVFRNM